MKKYIFTIFIMLAAVSPLYANEHDSEAVLLRELGHHWALPSYINEIRLQSVFILVVACVSIIYHLVRISKRKGQQNDKV
jgi:hypothetical protein